MNHPCAIFSQSDDLYERLREKATQVGRNAEDLATQWLVYAIRQSDDHPVAETHDPFAALIGSIDSIPWAEEHDRWRSHSLMMKYHGIVD